MVFSQGVPMSTSRGFVPGSCRTRRLESFLSRCFQEFHIDSQPASLTGLASATMQIATPDLVSVSPHVVNVCALTLVSVAEALAQRGNICKSRHWKTGQSAPRNTFCDSIQKALVQAKDIQESVTSAGAIGTTLFRHHAQRN
jgi:hypothetical protein